ncbi:MAG: hypothetical protein WA151_12305 [Desulfatirhabdiaceae bacterium]
MRNVTAFLAAIFVLGASDITMAGVSVNQTIGYEVQAINELSVSGSPSALIVNTAIAGFQPDPVSNALTTYAITTNGINKKITGMINTPMPDYVTLKITLVAPTSGSSVSEVTLGTTPADLVTGISQLAESAKTITYKLTALTSAGVIPSAVKTVTLTIADGT